MSDATLVYYGSGYNEVVGRMVKDCMNKAVDEVKALPDYSTKGEELKNTLLVIII